MSTSADWEPGPVRDRVLEHLRKQYLGPAGAEDEALRDRPDRVYLVGTLYPRGAAAERLDGDVLGEDAHDQELDEPVELANAWHPASAAVSFLHDGQAVRCTVAAAAYAAEKEGGWRRTPLPTAVELLEPDGPGVVRVKVLNDRARITSVWRQTSAGWLVTVALENLAVHEDPASPPPSDACLFQCSLSCEVLDGSVLPYPSSADISPDEEDQELALLYRHRRAYGVGHGCSVDWQADPDGRITTVATEMLPSTVVPAVRAAGLDLPVLALGRLADQDLGSAELCDELDAFVSTYATWVDLRRAEASSGTIESRHLPAAERLVERMDGACERMHAGVRLLREDAPAMLAFRLANQAMREQMLQTDHARRQPGVRGKPLAVRPVPEKEPAWRPFQLGFQLLCLASTAQDADPDRETVDLLWFPTGGGKTEAYLGLAAFEMILRRLTRGKRGGGTAVITRYTLRLLTTQQFQRSATLICALERLRAQGGPLAGSAPFTIGLWVGNETTPGDYTSAHKQLTDLRKAQSPESPFQVQDCAWCGTGLFPQKRVPQADAYGARSTKHSFELFCVHKECPFHELLPVVVVDDQIYADPPTMVLGTVDKFARLPWLQKAGSIFGQDNVPYDAPGLVIQDELHLLSGPLGTTVAIYEAAVQALLGWEGRRPKIVASTATIRAAGHQVRNLYAAPVALFPPSGLRADENFFAETDPEAPGRLYLGLMPQAHTQAFATVLSCVALLQAPKTLGLQGPALDAYWTLVAYHNSLRELGRTVTIARDDVESMLRARAREGLDSRSIRGEGVVELTSNVPAAQLPRLLARLERDVRQADAVDLVATTNMLSVGIDISRLGVMLMNGQPKTTSEYIQATSRVGRSKVPGLVVTLLRASKPRDRSHYEAFRSYHEALYKHVEPTSVTPWSMASRDRSLHAALTILVRHGCGLRENEQAGDFSAEDPLVLRAVKVLAEAAARADETEAEAALAELQRLVGEWHDRARKAEAVGAKLRYDSSSADNPALLCDFGEKRQGWETMHSMRSVDRQVRVMAIGEGRR